jgi:hypothetical protein
VVPRRWHVAGDPARRTARRQVVRKRRDHLAERRERPGGRN